MTKYNYPTSKLNAFQKEVINKRYYNLMVKGGI